MALVISSGLPHHSVLGLKDRTRSQCLLGRPGVMAGSSGCWEAPESKSVVACERDGNEIKLFKFMAGCADARKGGRSACRKPYTTCVYMCNRHGVQTRGSYRGGATKSVKNWRSN